MTITEQLRNRFMESTFIVAAAVIRETQCTPEMAMDAAKRSAKQQAGEVITVESAGLVIAGAVEIVCDLLP